MLRHWVAGLFRLLTVLAFAPLILLFVDYPKADRWGNPIIPDPVTGRERSWTRVTTIAKALDDGGGLPRWTGAMVAGGCATRPDLLGKIAARWPITDANRSEIYAISEELKEAGGGNVGRNNGDVLHEMLRRRNQGEDFHPMPPFDLDIKAHDDLIERAGLIIDPEYVERTVLLPEIGVAGTADLFPRIRGRGDERMATDYKTGAVRDYVWSAWIVQTCLYAHASWIYSWETGEFTPMPPVRQDRALIISVPAGTATADLFVLDISTAWKAVKAAIWVRQWRKEARDLARPARLNK